MRRRRLATIGVAVAAVLLLGIPARRVFHGFSLVVRAGDLHGVARRVADLDTVPITERLVRVPLRDLSIRARVYAPAGTPRQTVLLVAGLHPTGIEEPRLVALSRRLAEAHVTVVTPDIPELSSFEITPLLTDRIEESAVWLATASGLAEHGRIGLIGVSFSGGLAVVAAGRPSLRDHLRYVLSFGGHDDLLRVLEYFCAGATEATSDDVRTIGPPTKLPPPHDFGLAVALLNVAHDLVPPEQVPQLRDAVGRFLGASFLDRTDKPLAQQEFAALRDLARSLPEPSAALLSYVNERDVARLGPRLLPHIGRYAGPPALSPSRSPLPTAPVFLLHGREDSVIPSAEAEAAAARLRGRVRVRLLLTDLVSHADADQPAHVPDIMRLAVFWGALLAQ